MQILKNKQTLRVEPYSIKPFLLFESKSGFDIYAAGKLPSLI